MLRLRSHFRRSHRRALSGYWDDVVTRAPATPMPSSDAPTDLTSTIRQIHSLEQQGQQSAPFAQRQRQMLLARHQVEHDDELSSTCKATGSDRARAGPDEETARVAPGIRAMDAVLNVATILALVLGASLAGSRLVDRRSSPGPTAWNSRRGYSGDEATPTTRITVIRRWPGPPRRFYGGRRLPLYVPIALAVGPTAISTCWTRSSTTLTGLIFGDHNLGTWDSTTWSRPDSKFNLNNGDTYLGANSLRHRRKRVCF